MEILFAYIVITPGDVNEPCYIKLGLNPRRTNYIHRRKGSFQEEMGTLRTVNKGSVFC